MSNQTRREFMKMIGGTAISAMAISTFQGCNAINMNEISGAGKRRPNIIFLLTDDLGYGDLGCHGNPVIKTPNIDKFAKESVEFEQFYGLPVCAPTRACLLTGRYNYRTGVVDNYLARTNLKKDEVIIAQMLKDAGYKTAMFGKWHIGPNYPMRPEDKGFDEVVLRALGVVNMPDAADRETRRFDPVFRHNGQAQKYEGFSHDILTDEAIRFITENRDRPFFVYFPTNLPHHPLNIGDKYADPYRKMGLKEETARLYGTVANIDGNFGRLLGKLEELGLEGNTIVIFMSDNGARVTTPDRFLAGLRGTKTTVYEGGIKVPCFVRWPKKFSGGRKVNTVAAHIDIVPTLLEACGVAKPEGIDLDGRSLMPLLKEGDESKVDWPDRTLFFQWHRADRPEKYRAFAVRNKRFKLVQAVDIDGKKPPSEFKYELFDIIEDPGEKNDLSAKYPKIVESMKRQYEEWFKDVTQGQSYEPQNIYLGTRHENPVILTRTNWRGAKGMGDKDPGYWLVDCKRGGKYEVTCWLSPKSDISGTGKVYFKFKGTSLNMDIDADVKKAVFENVQLEKGPGRLEAWLEFNGQKIGPKYVDVKWIG